MRGGKATRAPRRWLKIRDVAEQMQIEHPSAEYRRKYVRRLLKRLEKRDGTRYMRQVGTGRTSPWYVSPAALEALEPYSATALGKMRDDLEETREDVHVIQRKLNSHGSRIRSLEKFRKATDAYIRAMGE